MPSPAAIPASSTAPSMLRWSIPGSDAIGVRRSPPATTNIGYTRCDADSSVSRVRPRSDAVWRMRRMRVAGKAMGSSLGPGDHLEEGRLEAVAAVEPDRVLVAGHDAQAEMRTPAARTSSFTRSISAVPSPLPRASGSSTSVSSVAADSIAHVCDGEPAATSA